MVDYIHILNQWEKNRHLINSPCVFHEQDHLENIREKVSQEDEALCQLRSDLQEQYEYLLNFVQDDLINMIPDTTPGPCLFNLPPEHDAGMPHGMWKWNPLNPDYITDEVTGTVFPNDQYKEEGVLNTTWGKPQTFTFYTGKGMEYNRYYLYPSFTGMIRYKKTEYMIHAAYNLALLYYLTDDLRYALKSADILLRFADVYPYWLVHGMYGDIADMDPVSAGADPRNLPKERTCMAPNEPKKEIHVGYWGLARGSCSGMEGSQITLPAAIAYDLIAGIQMRSGTPILTQEEKLHIEKNLLIESATLTYNDPALNNKNTGNRIGIMAVGLVTGIDDFVHMGIDCFKQIVENWYLKDGSTSESPAYSMMVMNTMWILSEMLEGYKGFSHTEEPVPVYDWYKYHAVWKGMYDTLLQNLLYPASADSYPDSALNPTYCNILARRFNRPEYWALLANTKTKNKERAIRGIKYIANGDEGPKNPALIFRDQFFPELRQGYLRIGKDNSMGTLILNASEWGIHHHQDSLNLYYFYNGTEWLSDLGYLWDQPHKHMTVRTAAHQLVIVDEKEQVTKGRNGFLHHFVVKEPINLVDLSSDVYTDVDTYRRASLIVEHEDNRHYILDLFHVDGGTVKDYLLHGINFNYVLQGCQCVKSDQAMPYDLKDAIELSLFEQPRVTWNNGRTHRFDVFLPKTDKSNEATYMTKGFGQRGKTDLGAEIPYLLRRYDGTDAHTFVTVMGASQDRATVKCFNYETDSTGKSILVRIMLEDGTEDGILYQFEKPDHPFETSLGSISFDGVMAYITITDNKANIISMYGGTSLIIGGCSVNTGVGHETGDIEDTDEFGFYVNVPLDTAKRWIGNTVYITDGIKRTGYPVVDVAQDNGRVYIRTLNESGDGFMFMGGSSWRMEYYVNFDESSSVF